MVGVPVLQMVLGEAFQRDMSILLNISGIYPFLDFSEKPLVFSFSGFTSNVR